MLDETNLIARIEERIYLSTMCNISNFYLLIVVVLDHTKECGHGAYTKGKAVKVAEDSKLLSQTLFGIDLIPFPTYSEEFLKANMLAKNEKWAKPGKARREKAQIEREETAGRAEGQLAEEPDAAAPDMEDAYDAMSAADKAKVAALEAEEKILSYIQPKLQNWKMDRLATIDVIILKMSIAEMINFPSIPTKATINEYVEIAKNYSTDKSKEFVNGILDSLMKDLIKDGVIVKTGRGLQ